MNTPQVASESGSGNPADLDALALMQQFASNDLPRVKARADKWVAGLGAITGVLTTAALIKGPDTLTKVSGKNLVATMSPRDIIVVLLVAGGVALAAGIWNGYQAANGSPLADDAIEVLATTPQPSAAGAAAKWTSAVNTATRGAKNSLRNAAIATLLGTALLAAALIYASYNPAPSSGDAPACIRLADGGVVQFDGALPAVTKGELTEIACASS